LRPRRAPGKRQNCRLGALSGIPILWTSYRPDHEHPTALDICCVSRRSASLVSVFTISIGK
ncbi:MAG: hypothetical protein ACYSUP_14230, partial [Planctomycetota bacterium]